MSDVMVSCISVMTSVLIAMTKNTVEEYEEMGSSRHRMGGNTEAHRT